MSKRDYKTLMQLTKKYGVSQMLYFLGLANDDVKNEKQTKIDWTSWPDKIRKVDLMTQEEKLIDIFVKWLRKYDDTSALIARLISMHVNCHDCPFCSPETGDGDGTCIKMEMGCQEFLLKRTSDDWEENNA